MTIIAAIFIVALVGWMWCALNKASHADDEMDEMLDQKYTK